MDSPDRTARSPDQGWDRYWRGIKNGGNPGVGGANHARLDEFWREFFVSLHAQKGPRKLVDIGSGDGAVVAFAVDVLGARALDVTCVDISGNAVDILQKRFPSVRGVVASALQIPLPSASFDSITSQFGVEYAGMPAFDEAVRLVAPGGQLALLIHHRSGAMQRECSAGLDAAQQLKACKFIPRSIAMFEAGFAALSGESSALYDSAVRDLLPAFRSLEDIMQQHGAHVAGDTVLRLYQDVDSIHQQLEQYDPEEILTWLAAMDKELDTYCEMMTTMQDAALDESQFDELCDGLVNSGMNVQQAQPLTADGLELPLAWALLANKPP